MADYSAQAFCDECGLTHSMGVFLWLKDGPVNRASIADAFSGRDMPVGVKTLTDSRVWCPVTGRFTVQRDNHQVFLTLVAA